MSKSVSDSVHAGQVVDHKGNKFFVSFLSRENPNRHFFVLAYPNGAFYHTALGNELIRSGEKILWNHE